jgi:AAA domain, putative AbiEii toxin, Type IV TA system
MIEQLIVDGFRGIERAQFGGFTDLSILVGPNNAGKSAILEAIYVGAHRYPGNAIDRVAFRKRLPNDAGWLFWRRRKDCSIEVIGGDFLRRTDLHNVDAQTIQFSLQQPGFESSVKEQSVLKSRQYPNRPDPTKFTVPKSPFARLLPFDENSDLAESYSHAVDIGMRAEAMGIVEKMLPNVERVEILLDNGSPRLYGYLNDGNIVPATLMGDGAQNLLGLSLSLMLERGSIALLEEPELHKHPAAIRATAETILTAVRRGIQCVVATHSIDLIDGCLEMASSDQEIEQLSVFRIKNSGGQVTATRIAGKELAFSRGQIMDDIR